ncbi:hypothetical protein JCM8547_006660 [Rhodosporidiobolus lusitaniae]
MAPKSTGLLFSQPSDKGPADLTAEEIPPLAFDLEEEVRELLNRFKEDLRGRARSKAEGGEKGGKKGKGKALGAEEKKKVEELVLKQFYTPLESIILSNCTIAGHSWSVYKDKKKKGELSATQPFDDVLHQRVLKYQNDLFDAREINARERVDAPARTADGRLPRNVQAVLDLDAEHLAKLEGAPIQVPEELQAPRAPRSRKSIGGAAALEAPAPVEAQHYYEQGRQTLDRLLEDIPRLITAAEEATKVAVDAAALA